MTAPSAEWQAPPTPTAKRWGWPVIGLIVLAGVAGFTFGTVTGTTSTCSKVREHSSFTYRDVCSKWTNLDSWSD